MLNDEERKDLIRYRIERAYKVLEEARDNAKLGHWNLTGNRLYELRQSGDYDDKYDATEEEIMPYFEQVEALQKAMVALIGL